MCRVRSRKLRGGNLLPSWTPRETQETTESISEVPDEGISPGRTSSTEAPALGTVGAVEGPSDVIIGSCCLLILFLLAFAYWIYRHELKRSNISLPTSRLAYTRRKLDTPSEQTPFGGVLGVPPRSSKYDSMQDESDVPEAKVLLDDSIAQQKMEAVDYFQLPSCSQTDLTRLPATSLSSLTRKRHEREEKIQNRNVLFEKLLSGEEELEVFVVHEERC